MGHGWLSNKYRNNLMWNSRGGMISTPYTAADICLRELIGEWGAICIMRNGPRILRAMNTVRAEMEAKVEHDRVSCSWIP